MIKKIKAMVYERLKAQALKLKGIKIKNSPSYKSKKRSNNKKFILYFTLFFVKLLKPHS